MFVDGRQRMRSASGIVAAALLGALMGLLDFVLFELQGSLAGFREYVLYRPGVFGPSMFFYQLLAYAALGTVCFSLVSLVRLIISKPLRRWGAILVLPLSSVTLGLGMIALRVDLNSGQPYRLTLLIAGFAVLFVYGFLVQRSWLEATGERAVGPERSARLRALLLLGLMLAALLSPDLYSVYARIGRRPESQPLKSPNVLFIVLDAVRADHLSCYGYQLETTPNIDRLSREGALFLHAFSAAPWTLPSHASMFTGLFPAQHQADWGHVYLDRRFPTLAGCLRDDGYRTVGFAENVFVSRNFGLAGGFEEFFETWRRPLIVRALAKIASRGLGYRDRLDCPRRSIGLFERWLRNNRDRERPFFAFINFMSAHLPRYPRPGFGRRDWPADSLKRIQPVNLLPERFYVPRFRLNDADLAVMADVYDSDISYLDSQVGQLVAFLTEEGILDNTVLIVTSDHGENFGEHGLIEHQFCLYDTLLRVPLVVRYPALVKPGRIQGRVSTVSLFKTVLALARTPRSEPSGASRSDPLAALREQDTVVAECSDAGGMLRGSLGSEGRGVDFSRFDRSLRCIAKGPYKFIWSSDGRSELYRIEDDPSEVNNLCEKEPDQARVLNQLLTSWEQSMSRRLPF